MASLLKSIDYRLKSNNIVKDDIKYVLMQCPHLYSDISRMSLFHLNPHLIELFYRD